MENQTLKNYIIDLKARVAVYVPIKDDVIDNRMAEFINNYPDRNKLKVITEVCTKITSDNSWAHDKDNAKGRILTRASLNQVTKEMQEAVTAVTSGKSVAVLAFKEDLKAMTKVIKSMDVARKADSRAQDKRDLAKKVLDGTTVVEGKSEMVESWFGALAEKDVLDGVSVSFADVAHSKVVALVTRS